MKSFTTKLYVFAALSISLLLSACGGGGGGSGTSQGPGTLGVSLTDAPSCGYDAVYVTVQKVRVHQSASANENDAGWTDITLNPARKINLLNLTNGSLDSLGQTPLAAGHYTQVRLVLDPNTGASLANSVVPEGNINEISLDTPSAVQSGIKLINEFDVTSGQRVDLVLDFDACKSIITKGNGRYALKPVIKVIPTVLNGIGGFIKPTLLGSNVIVSAQQNGTVIRSTVPNTSTGEFFIARLAPGNYDVVITADNHATSVIATVPVASTTTTVNLSNIVLPIDLPNSAVGTISGTAVLNPTSTTEVAYVAAKQSFASGPVVTVKYQGADVVNGSYSLSNLALAAPLLASYSSTLPVVFIAHPNTIPGTGKYAVEASATGYVTQTNPNVNISLINQSGLNFSLTP